MKHSLRSLASPCVSCVNLCSDWTPFPWLREQTHVIKSQNYKEIQGNCVYAIAFLLVWYSSWLAVMLYTGSVSSLTSEQHLAFLFITSQPQQTLTIAKPRQFKPAALIWAHNTTAGHTTAERHQLRQSFQVLNCTSPSVWIRYYGVWFQDEDNMKKQAIPVVRPCVVVC